MRRVLQEPLLHFILLGVAIVAAHQVIAQRSALTHITITQNQVRHLADNYRAQYGSPPTPQQLEALANDWITREMLYREALKLGLDREDEIIRRRLVQKYEFLQADLAIPAEPTDAQLLAYYRQHPDRYVRPAGVTFTQVYFSPDARGEQGAREAASALASRLNHTTVVRAVDQGDRFPGPSDFAALSSEEAARVFGQGELAEVLFKVEVGRWSPAVRSGYGWHTVYVSARQQPRQVPFSEMREKVEEAYRAAERQRLQRQQLAKLAATYRIVRE